MGGLAKARQVNLPSPGARLGSRSARLGPPGTPPRPPAVGVLHTAHGRLLEGGAGAWAVGQGAPNETPRPFRRVGGGLGVGGR